MRRPSLSREILRSYRSFASLTGACLLHSRDTHARLTLRRSIALSLFLPAMLAWMTWVWLGLALDELLFPRYRQVDVREPLFVVGVPRSGTTFLHRVLAEDRNRFTVYRLWQMLLAPAVCQRKLCHAVAALDRRCGAPLAGLVRWVEAQVQRRFDAIHRISLADPEEDYLTLAPIFACFLLILPFPFPDRLGYLARFDDSASHGERERVMGFYRSIVQRHLCAEGVDKTFLSKNVAFGPMVEALCEAFPDARIVATVRNPLQAIPSHLSSMRAGFALFDNAPQGNDFRDWMISVQRYAFTHVPRFMDEGPPDRRALITMEQLTGRLEATLRGVYDRFGMTMMPEFAQRLAERAAAQRRFASNHRYRLEDFDLDPHRVREEFADVCERFGYDAPEAATR